jgi:RNA-directed DNA polymerase
MKESYWEGLANHPDPESCAGSGNTPGEALTGAHAGEAIELRNSDSPACRPDGLQGKATPEVPPHREGPRDAAESKNLGMRGNSMHENRETPHVSRVDDLERPEKDDRKSGMYAGGESDGSIVPMKQANNGGPPPAELVEGRGLTKGNVFQIGRLPDPVPEKGVVRIGRRAASVRHLPKVGAV